MNKKEEKAFFNWVDEQETSVLEDRLIELEEGIEGFGLGELTEEEEEYLLIEEILEERREKE